MANYADYKAALVKAHRAGDTRGAQVIADRMRSMAGDAPTDVVGEMSPVRAGLVSAGKTFTDFARGARELFGEDISGEQAEANRLYAPVAEQQPVASFAGRAAPAVLASIPSGGSLLGAVGTGTALGALDPEQSALSGGALGAVGYGAGKLLQGAPRLFNRQAVEEAEKLGFQLTPGARVGSRGMMAAEESAKSTPFVGSALHKAAQRNQRIVNKIASKAIQAGGKSRIDDEALNRARDVIGKKFETAVKGKTLALDNRLLDDLAAIEKDTPAQLFGRDISDVIDFVMDQVGGGKIEGPKYLAIGKQLASAARSKMRSNPDMGRAFYRVREALDDWAERTIKGGDAVKAARRQWRDLLAIDSATDVATGNVSGLKLAQALDRQGRLGGSDALAGAARFARRFRPIVGDSGTATRSSLPLFGLGAALGGPEAAATMGLGALGANVAGRAYQGMGGTPGIIRQAVLPPILRGALQEANPALPLLPQPPLGQR